MTAEQYDPDQSAKAPEDTAGAQVLNEAQSHIGRFLVFPHDGCLPVVTLWCAATWIHQVFPSFGRLALLSDEPGSGKTKVQQVMMPLCCRPEDIVDPTGPVLATMIDQMHPTTFLDETDTIWTAGGSDSSNRKLRAILNKGYKRGGTLPRKNGKTFTRESVYGPVCFAGLGNLPRTIMTRSLVIRMEPRKPGQLTETYYDRSHSPMGEALGKALGEWTATIAEDAEGHWPEMPDGITDRKQEISEALLTIADLAGGHWPATARAAVRTILLDQSEASGPTPAQQLLSDVRAVWPRSMPAVHSQDLASLLTSDQTMAWGSLWSPDNAQRELSMLLRSLSPAVSPVKVTVARKSLQGYRRSDFAVHWLAADRLEETGTNGDDDE
jgi:hypothetical protein